MDNGKYMLEHRYVVEQRLRRKLKRSEVIHHRNGNCSDNRDENLQMVTGSEHAKIHRNAEIIGLEMMSTPIWNPSIDGMGC